MAGKTQPFDDASLLSKEEQDTIRARARNEVQKERADAATKSFLEKALADERKRNNVGPQEEELVAVLIDLPGFAHGITVNNQTYFHAHTYTLPMSKARDIQSMMARAWEHENEVGGANRDVYRRPNNQVLRPGSM